MAVPRIIGLSEMLEDFDRQDVEELYRLVKERYSASRPEGYDLMLWGDLHTLFEPDVKRCGINMWYQSLVALDLGRRIAPYTPQQNGVAEKKNRVLQDMINVVLVSANLPKNL
ncbi:putative ribonuclease H-like domain-containing protein [Tanacetum coccineum]